MALVVKDRVKESSTTSGTGTLTLAGAATGFQAFSAALSNGDTTYYAIAESSTGAWEVGLGTWATGSSTLARTTVLDSSNSGSAINLSGSGADVFITQPADKAAYFDAAGDLFLNQDPTSALQSATKQYVDSIAAAGIHYHDPVRVEREGNLTATYNNGTAGVGATLTNSGTQAALVIDGVTLNSADRVLVYEQTAPAQNGIYTVTNTGSASTNWVLTRATDADSYGPSDPDSLGQGDAFFVQEGAAGAGETYVMNTEGTITFGTTAITFAQFSSAQIYSAGNGLTLTGTTFAAGAGTGVTVNANDIAIGQDVGTSADVTFNTVAADLTGAVTGNVTGNASTASALQTARNIALTGAVTGSTSFDGSGNVSITTTATSDPTITLGGDLSGSATLTNLGNATLTATINANSVALGTDTTGNYVAGITAGAAITVSGSGSEGASPTINHADTSSQSSVNNSGATVIQDVTLDTYGHVTALGSHTLTLANLGYTGATNANYITNNNQLTNGAGYTTYTANQSLNTTNSPSFAGVNINGNLNAVDQIYLSGTLYHEGDTDTYLQFHALNEFRIVTGGTEMFEVNDSTVKISANLDVNGRILDNVEDIYLRDKLFHDGDTDTYLGFGANTITLSTGGSSEITVNTTGVRLGDTGNGYFQPVSGNYGSIQIDGGAHTGYEGYSIGGESVFMSNGSRMGLFDDANNEWAIFYDKNAGLQLPYNGSSKLQTTSSGVNVTGTAEVDTLRFADGTQQTTAASAGSASYLQQWVQKYSGTASALNSVAGNGSGNWVAVGSGGVVCISSNNGSTWTAANVSGATTFQDVATNGSGNWVAVGNSGQVYYSSNNGSSWTAGTSGITSEITGVATDGSGNWLLVAFNGLCRKSTNNGATWSYVTNPGNQTSQLRGIRYGNGSWLTWSASNILWRSTNTGTSFAYEEAFNISEKSVGTDGAGNWLVGVDRGPIQQSNDDGATWDFVKDYGFSFGSGSNSAKAIGGSGDGVIIANRGVAAADAGGGLTMLIYEDLVGGVSTSAANSGYLQGWRCIASDGAGSWVGVGSAGNIGVAQE